MRIDLIVGARSNFIIIAPIVNAIRKAYADGKNIYFRLIYTDHHFDKNMNESFFEQLNIYITNINLGAGGGT